jgi:hypothetical protein
LGEGREAGEAHPGRHARRGLEDQAFPLLDWGMPGDLRDVLKSHCPSYSNGTNLSNEYRQLYEQLPGTIGIDQGPAAKHHSGRVFHRVVCPRCQFQTKVN